MTHRSSRHQLSHASLNSQEHLLNEIETRDVCLHTHVSRILIREKEWKAKNALSVCVKVCHKVVGIAKRIAAPPVRFLIFEFFIGQNEAT